MRKLIRGKLPTKENYMEVNSECPFYTNHLETIDHMFLQSFFVKEIWNTVAGYCPSPINDDFHY